MSGLLGRALIGAAGGFATGRIKQYEAQEASQREMDIFAQKLALQEQLTIEAEKRKRGDADTERGRLASVFKSAEAEPLPTGESDDQYSSVGTARGLIHQAGIEETTKRLLEQGEVGAADVLLKRQEALAKIKESDAKAKGLSEKADEHKPIPSSNGAWVWSDEEGKYKFHQAPPSVHISHSDGGASKDDKSQEIGNGWLKKPIGKKKVPGLHGESSEITTYSYSNDGGKTWVSKGAYLNAIQEKPATEQPKPSEPSTPQKRLKYIRGKGLVAE